MEKDKLKDREDVYLRIVQIFEDYSLTDAEIMAILSRLLIEGALALEMSQEVFIETMRGLFRASLAQKKEREAKE